MAQEFKAKLNPFSGQLQLVPTNIVLAFKAGVAAQANLPLTGNAKGDARVANDTGHLYVWSLEATSGLLTDWIDAGDIVDIDWSVITNKPSSSVVNIDDAVSKKHVQGTDQGLDTDGVNATTAAQVKQAVTDDHTHTNKTILDSIQEALTTILKLAYDGAVSHAGLTSGNPHNVSKSDVNLGNVDNKSEATIITDVKADSSIADAITKKHASGSDAETTTTIGSLINGASNKDTPIDTDQIGLMDSLASNVLKKLSWANIKVTLKTYFDSLYSTIVNVNTDSSNIILNIFLFLKNAGTTFQNIVDGIVDAYKDELGIDTGSSVNQTYDAVNDLYKNFAGLVSQYPPAYNDTYVKATDGARTDGKIYFATNPALLLTGSYADNSWYTDASGTNVNQRVHIDLGTAKIITRLYYENFHNSGGATNLGAQNFTLWGSNEASSFAELTYGVDTGWTQLTTSQSSFDQHTASDVADPKYITVTNTTAYRYYAIKIADNYGESYRMGMRRIELQADAGALSMTLISNSSVPKTTPEEAKIVLMEEDVDAVTLNTDLLVYVSRNGGTDWSVGTLINKCDYATDKKVLVAENIDISSQVIGSGLDADMKYKIATANAKKLKIHGLGLSWK
jgi:hypothetical protein